ncbi:MAG TPA: chromate efflux transporter [Microbacteriaceae bacterium]|nr:chromate efflux transporter [Microbacteriaceae bacterium]
MKRTHPGSAGEVFIAFLRLGVTSFGGPIAHLAYFREAFVERRKWLSETAYAELVALCQFLPGPASSQVGMAIGLQRAGWLGLLAAWFAFTMPSAIVLVAFAYGATTLTGVAGTGWIQGFMAAAVAVVAVAVIGMARALTPDARRATIAGLALVGVLILPHPLMQVAAIVVAGLIGLVWLREPTLSDDAPLSIRVGRGAAIACLVILAVLLIGLPLLVALTQDPTARLIDIFTRAGSLVFGGGHVVLPLLEVETVQTGLVAPDAFLAGYGAAQAVPGPLFTFSAYLGAVMQSGPTGVLGATIALLAIFLPSGLLVVGALPFWTRLRGNRLARRALMGVNAAVVGILAAALYDPVFTEGVTSVRAFCVAAAAFIALLAWKAPPWAVVIGAGVIGWLVL